MFLIRTVKGNFQYTAYKSLILCVLDLVFTYVKHLEQLGEVSASHSETAAEATTYRTMEAEATEESLKQLRETNCIVMEWLNRALALEFSYHYTSRSLGEELQVRATPVSYCV